MKKLYVKTVLYATSAIDALLEQIKDTASRRASNSLWDFSPAIEQCNYIVNLTIQKGILLELREMLTRVYRTLSDYEMKCLRYKYFKNRPKSYYEGFGINSRTYFRTQTKVIEELSEKFPLVGLNDEYFEKYLMTIPFFRDVYRRTQECEEISVSRRVKREREKIVNFMYKTKVARNPRRLARYDRKENYM